MNHSKWVHILLSVWANKEALSYQSEAEEVHCPSFRLCLCSFTHFYRICVWVCDIPHIESVGIEWLLGCLWPDRLLQVENPSHNPIVAVAVTVPRPCLLMSCKYPPPSCTKTNVLSTCHHQGTGGHMTWFQFCF